MPAKLGIYAVAMALVAFLPIVLQSVNQIFSPTIADLYARGQIELLGRIFQTLTKWILGLTLPLAAGMIIFAPALMRIFGRDFEIGSAVSGDWHVGPADKLCVGSVGYLLLMSGHQRSLIRIQAVMACGILALNVVLIPRWGIMGAAIGAAVTNAVTNVWYLLEVRRKLGLLPYSRSYWRLLPPVCGNLAVLLMLKAILKAVRPEWIVIVAGISLAYLSFIAIAMACGLDADDRLIASAVWSKSARRAVGGGKRLMSSDVREVRLPDELCSEAERRFGARFGSVEELLVFVLRELLRDQAKEMDQAEQRIIEQRLKDLGYI